MRYAAKRVPYFDDTGTWIPTHQALFEKNLLSPHANVAKRTERPYPVECFSLSLSLFLCAIKCRTVLYLQRDAMMPDQVGATPEGVYRSTS